jgi:hypothetical protein
MPTIIVVVPITANNTTNNKELGMAEVTRELVDENPVTPIAHRGFTIYGIDRRIAFLSKF